VVTKAFSITLASNFIRTFHPWLWSKKFSKIANPEHALTKSLISQSKALLESGISLDDCLDTITRLGKSGIKLQHVNQLSQYIEVPVGKVTGNLLTSQTDVIHNLAYNDAKLKNILKVEDVFKYGETIFSFMAEKRHLDSLERLIKNYGLDEVLFSIDIAREKVFKVDKPIYLKRYFEDALLRKKHTLSLRRSAVAGKTEGEVSGKRRNRLSWDD